MRVKVTAVGYYDLPDDPEDLRRAWNTTSHEEAMKADAEVFDEDIGTMLDIVDFESVTVEEA